jgi:hypothetical protein
MSIAEDYGTPLNEQLFDAYLEGDREKVDSLTQKIGENWKKIIKGEIYYRKKVDRAYELVFALIERDDVELLKDLFENPYLRWWNDAILLDPYCLIHAMDKEADKCVEYIVKELYFEELYANAGSAYLEIKYK